MDHEARSRRLNACLGGDLTEMACARAHRLHLWPVVWLLDLWFMVRWGEAPGHCLRIRDRERLRRLRTPIEPPSLLIVCETQDPLSLADGRFVDDNRRAGRL